MTVIPPVSTSTSAPGSPDRYALVPADVVNQVIKGNYVDVFGLLGMHAHESGNRQVTVFLPGAQAVDVMATNGKKSMGTLQCIHEEGLFSGIIERKRQTPYRLKVTYPGAEVLCDDPYRFPSLLDETDIYLFNNGTQEQAWRFLGANHRVFDDVPGIVFAVWAPNARRVSLVSSANDWDGRVHVMRRHPSSGIWDIFIPNLEAGTLYKYEIQNEQGKLLQLKADPYARQMQSRPHTASVVPAPSRHEWKDQEWMEQRRSAQHYVAPVSVYEVHLDSWKHKLDGGDDRLSYRELAEDLVGYAKYMGFTHIQLMPVSEYPFGGSWGYQPLGMYAPLGRYGSADDFRYFIDRAHQSGIGVLIDWVPGHFPSDAHGLAHFDGTHLYEHADSRKGFHPDWNTCIFNYGRAEVVSYLLSNVMYWLGEFHIDGIRFDAVASMLYLDYSRQNGEWIPNRHGGRENLEAIDLLRMINNRAYFNFPGIMMVAEESTAWPGVTHFTDQGGLGFGFKWNMGWMNDTLRYLARDPAYRKFHHNEMTFGLLYAYTENFILALSHDEVVHGKRSILERVPGEDWQKFATLRTYYAFMWTHPGKKLLFMGDEIAQRKEWDADSSLDWHLTQYPQHQGVQLLVRDLNGLYREHPALYELDHSSAGFEWIDADDCNRSIFIYARKGRGERDRLIVVLNFTPVGYQDLRVGVPGPGYYAEKFNSDARPYGGSGQGNLGGVSAEHKAAHGREWSIGITLPPLTALIFAPND